jgi:exonuclease III
MKNKTKRRTRHNKHNKRNKQTKQFRNPIQKGGTTTEIKALTYNLSWASQKNEKNGSEADFVEQCKRVYRKCYQKALEKITILHKKHTFDVIGIQEVEDKDLVSTICKNTELQGWYRGATWNSKMKVYSGCAIIWNTNTLGAMETGKTINLASPDPKPDPKTNCYECDARTCCIVTTTKGVNLIVAHFPWLNDKNDVDRIANIIEEHISSDGPIIILADTNDEYTLISSTSPLKIKNKELSHGLTVAEAKKQLNSCCWHKIGHKYKHFTGTGDYILSEIVKDIKIPIEHPTNNKNEKELYSDHMPVIATIELSNLPDTPITSAKSAKPVTPKPNISNTIKTRITNWFKTRPITSAISNSSKKVRLPNWLNKFGKKNPESVKYVKNSYESTV